MRWDEMKQRARNAAGRGKGRCGEGGVVYGIRGTVVDEDGTEALRDRKAEVRVRAWPSWPSWRA